MPEYYLIIILIILALSFDFINGFHDTANAIATCIATRALNPKVAIIMSAVLNFVGAMVSTGVAKTIGGDIVTSPSMVDSVVLIAANLLESAHLEGRSAVQFLTCPHRRYLRGSYYLLWDRGY